MTDFNLQTSDSKREFALEVVQRLQQAQYTAFWAGGCVRDLLLGHPPSDYDVATNAEPDTVRALFGPRRTLAVGASFGVIIVRGPRPADNVEVATFRNEGPYLDGRRPQHVTFSTAEEDAQRRDFTINGIFFDPLTGQVQDFVGGQADLKAGVIRAIGNAAERFREDKLRMLRAVRFTARFEYELEAHTADSVRQMAPEIGIVSQERITQELKKMLEHRTRARAMDLAHDLGLLVQILPELMPALPRGEPPLPAGTGAGADAPWATTLRRLDQLREPGFELALAALLDAALPSSPTGQSGVRDGNDGAIETLCRRMRLSNKELEQIVWLLDNRNALEQAPHLPASRFRRLMAHPHVNSLVELHRVKAVVDQTDLRAVEFCEEYLRTTPPEEIAPPLLLTGDDLVRHGLKPGAAFKQILEDVRDAQLDGTIHTRAEALALVDRLRETR